MVTAEQVANTGGLVRVGHLTFLVRELPLDGEIGLRSRIRAAARDALGPGGLMANALPVVRWLREQGEHADAAALVAGVAPLVATRAGVSDDAADLYRQSPAGVALELYYRTREAHPDATEQEIRAVVNEANCLEVHVAILRALDPSKKAATPSGSSTPSSAST